MLISILKTTLLFLFLPITETNELSPEELLGKLKGTWQIDIRMRMSPDTDFRKMQGEATFKNHYGESQIKESFSLGGQMKGEAFINYATAHNRYELYQIDMMSSRRSSLYLVGQYDEETGKLKFRDMENHPQWGKSPAFEIKWEYIFYEDGSFKKEMYLKDQKGEYFLQSDYHYKKKN